MNDYSFLRLEPTLEKAKYLRNSPMVKLGEVQPIRLSPKGNYLQITNTPDGIAFNGNFAVYVVDCGGVELQNITSKVAISEFIDNNGKNQIAFEISYINTDYYLKPVLLKFAHTVSSAVWFSNPINITDYQSQKCSEFDYRGYSEFNGIAYNRANFYQSIRLACFFDVNNSESSSKEYTSIDGIKVTSRLIETEYEKYKFEQIDNFTYRRLNKLLSSEVVFINSYHATNKQTLESSDRAGDTPNMRIDFEVAINYKEEYNRVFQIHEPLELIQVEPFETVTSASEVRGTFNRNISYLSGELIILKDGLPFLSEIPTVSGNQISLSYDFTENGVYRVLIPNGLIISDLGETGGFEWTFTIAEGEYSSTDYNNDEYLT